MRIGEKNWPVRTDTVFLFFLFFILRRVTQSGTMHIGINGVVMAFIAMIPKGERDEAEN